MTAIGQELAMPKGEGDLTIEAHGMEPIPESVRYGSVGRVFTVWFTPNLVPAAFFIGTLVTLDFLKLGFVDVAARDRRRQPGRLVLRGAAEHDGPAARAGPAAGGTPPVRQVDRPAGTAQLDQHHRLGRHQQRVRCVRADDPDPGPAVLGGPADRRRLPGRAGDLRLRGDPHSSRSGGPSSSPSCSWS